MTKRKKNRNVKAHLRYIFGKYFLNGYVNICSSEFTILIFYDKYTWLDVEEDYQLPNNNFDGQRPKDSMLSR